MLGETSLDIGDIGALVIASRLRMSSSVPLGVSLGGVGLGATSTGGKTDLRKLVLDHGSARSERREPSLTCR